MARGVGHGLRAKTQVITSRAPGVAHQPRRLAERQAGVEDVVEHQRLAPGHRALQVGAHLAAAPAGAARRRRRPATGRRTPRGGRAGASARVRSAANQRPPVSRHTATVSSSIRGASGCGQRLDAASTSSLGQQDLERPRRSLVELRAGRWRGAASAGGATAARRRRGLRRRPRRMAAGASSVAPRRREAAAASATSQRCCGLRAGAPAAAPRRSRPTGRPPSSGGSKIEVRKCRVSPGGCGRCRAWRSDRPRACPGR